ncbi:MAG: HAMP domain-containing histidine kinase [Pseudomonadales bacterium]|jgi:signal transduction histidine kinase|nr:HAMP domain-containing histidine kinase [Pseudomonadales bacterium]
MTRVDSWRLNLKLRIILALVLITTTMSSLFAYGVLEIKSKLEAAVFGETVRNQLHALQLEREAGTYDASHLFKNWAFYFDANLADLPPHLTQVKPGGYHSVLIDRHYYQVEVSEDQAGNPLVLTYDITFWEHQEHEVLTLLAYSIGIQLLAAIVLGWLASRAILAPVHTFTQRLAAIDPRQRQVRIAQDFKGSEIGLIATAFDHYLARLDRFVERERFFTAAASHELRTPLSVMIGALDILDNAALDGPTARARLRLHRACTEMKAFIEAALLLAREDSTTIEEEPRCDVQRLINDLLEDHQATISAHHITIERSTSDDLILEYSPSLLRIVLGNLLRNAIEHTHDGRIGIQLSSRAISIEDNGSGIPSADLPRVFERSYTTKQDGNGLGLNLVKRICDRFGWRIEFQSELGKGTRVTLLFTS